MSLTVECPGCHIKIQVPETAAGKRGKCKSCGSIVSVPQARSTSSKGVRSAGPAQQPLVLCSRCGNQFPYTEVIEIGRSAFCLACNKTRVAATAPSSAARTPPPDRKLTFWQLHPISCFICVSAAVNSVVVLFNEELSVGPRIGISFGAAFISVLFGWRFWSAAKHDVRFRARDGKRVPGWVKMAVGMPVVALAVIFPLVLISEARDARNKADEAARQAAAAKDAQVTASLATKEKAADMRAKGFNGTDEELSRTSDRIQSTGRR